MERAPMGMSMSMPFSMVQKVRPEASVVSSAGTFFFFHID